MVNLSHPTVLALNLPSCAILAVDSCVFDNNYGEIISSRYDKTIELRPCVFLACFGDCRLIDQVRDALANLPNHRSMGEIAHFVQNTVNTVLENSGDGDGEESYGSVEFVLVGRGLLDNRCYFYKISKGEDTWMYFAKREVGRVVCAGSEDVTTFLENNKLNENMKEGEAVDCAFKCVKYAVENDWVAGGRIQVVAVKPGSCSSIVHSWEQNYPANRVDKYHYQEPRINHGQQDRVSPEGKQLLLI